jgi:hypothetical protein
VLKSEKAYARATLHHPLDEKADESAEGRQAAVSPTNSVAPRDQSKAKCHAGGVFIGRGVESERIKSVAL